METETRDPRWLAYTRKHFETVLAHGVDRSGTHPSLMWYANLATPDATQLAGGCDLYSDMPLLAAAHRFAELVGEEKVARSADEYVRGFTERCLARTGIPLWGPHYSFDPAKNMTMRQASPDAAPVPCDRETETGDLHRIGPVPPAWELLWRINPAIAEEAILGAAQCQIIDPLTGQFSQRADRNPHAASVASGGALVEALAWLVRHVEGDFPMQLARGVADYPFAHHDATTGLMPDNPAADDDASRTTATARVGIWAGCLIRAAALADEPGWVGLADEAMSAWLTRAFDPDTGTFASTVDTRTGLAKGTLNMWSEQDAALEAAHACFLLYGETEDAEYAAACKRWRNQIAASLPDAAACGATAGRYGRAIHFLKACSEEWPDEDYGALARHVANAALTTLWSGSMFRSAPGKHACRSSEGIGHLILALLYLHTEREPHMMGSGW